MKRSDPSAGRILRRWLEERVLPAFADRVLPFDLSVIAAIAQAADAVVVTRNTKHFDPLGVRCLNPWEPTA